MSEFLQKLHQVKTVRELFELITWDMLQYAAAVPFLLFILSPVSLLIHNTFQLWSLETTIETTNQIMIGYVPLLAAFCLVKFILEKRSFKELLQKRVYWFFLGLLVMIVISTIANPQNPYHFRATWRQETVVSYFIYILGYFGCSSFITRSYIKSILFRLLQMASMLQAVLVFADRHLVRVEVFHRMQYANNITSVFSNRNFYAYYLTIVILLSAALFVRGTNKKWRIFDGVCFALNSFTLMRADTLGCFLAGLVGLIFLGIMLKIIDGKIPKTVWILIAVFLVLFAVNSFISSDLFDSLLVMFGDIDHILRKKNAENAGVGRWRLWTHTVQYIGERPLLGWGNEGIADRLEQEAKYSRPHNEYLQYTAFWGIPGGVCYIGALLSVFLHGLRHKKELDLYTIAALAASFAYITSAFFGNTVYSVAPYFFCILGLALRPCKDRA